MLQSLSDPLHLFRGCISRVVNVGDLTKQFPTHVADRHVLQARILAIRWCVLTSLAAYKGPNLLSRADAASICEKVG